MRFRAGHSTGRTLLYAALGLVLAVAPALAQEPAPGPTLEVVPATPGDAPPPAVVDPGPAAPADAPVPPAPVGPPPAAAPAPLPDPLSAVKGGVAELRKGPLLIHGNYCGIGAKPGSPPPIDPLDAACMRHDSCTRTGKLPSCACNARLQREATAVAQDPRTPPDIAALAATTAAGMAVLICK